MLGTSVTSPGLVQTLRRLVVPLVLRETDTAGSLMYQLVALKIYFWADQLKSARREMFLSRPLMPKPPFHGAMNVLPSQSRSSLDCHGRH